MTNHCCLIIFGVVAVGEFCGGHLVAQSIPDAVAPAAATPVGSIASAESSTPAVPAAAQLPASHSYVSALDGSGLIDLDHLHRSHVEVGATVASGLDSNPQSLSAGDSSATYVVSPYVEVHGSGPRTRFLIQYQPTFGGYSGYPTQTMHVVSGELVRNVTARWVLTTGGIGSHGEDALRLDTPLRAVTIGSAAGANPDAASYLPNAGVITNIEGFAELSSNLSARSSLHIRLANSYTSVPSWQKTSTVAEESVSYRRGLTPTWSFLAYQKNEHYYGSLDCTTVGGGAGLQWQPSQSVSVSASAGPQIDTPSCGAQQGFAYTLAVSSTMPHSSEVYLYAAREPASGYLGPGLWQDGVTAGYRRRLRRVDAFTTEAGYVHSSSLLTTGSYQGIFFNSTYSHVLRSGLVVGGSYRNYTNRADQVSSLRNIVSFSLAWTPRLGSHVAR